MLEIKLSDPHLMDKEILIKTARYLMDIAEAGMSSNKSTPGDLNPGIPTYFPPQIEIPAHTPVMKPTVDLAEIFKNPSPPIQGMVGSATTNFGETIVIVEPRPSIDAPIELDSEGLQWDAEIHSRAKTKTSDGKWRMKRTVEKPVEVPPPPPIAITEKELAPIEDPHTFPKLMTKITTAVNAKQITPAEIMKIINDAGLPSLPIISTRADLIPQVFDAIDKKILGI